MSDRPLVGIGVLVVKDGKVLLGKRKNAHGAGEYASPGGHLEYLETIAACAAREVREETGLEIGPVRFLRVLEVMRYVPKHYIDIAVVADWVSGDAETREPDKIEGWAWYALDALPEPLFDTLPSALAALRRAPRDELSLLAATPVPTAARSTRLHFHIDTKDDVRAIEAALPAHQISIHPIEHAGAFLTGRLGDGDRALMQDALAVGRARHAIVELDEYVGQWTLRADGAIVVDAEYTLADEVDHTYPAFDDARCPDLPAWELHYGFDVPKAEHSEPPIALADLEGGWFMFANDKQHAYRCTEFSDGELAETRDRVVAHAKSLRAVLAAKGLASAVGFSLERVHGIWVFA